MITIIGGMGRLRVRTSFVSQTVRIDFYTARSHFFRGECDFAQPWLYYSIRTALWISLICEGYMHPCLLVRSLRVLSCWTASHATKIWRNRTSVRTSIFRLSACTYDCYYTARSHFSVDDASLGSVDCITAFEIAFEISLICEGCIDADLIVLSLRVMSC